MNERIKYFSKIFGTTILTTSTVLNIVGNTGTAMREASDSSEDEGNNNNIKNNNIISSISKKSSSDDDSGYNKIRNDNNKSNINNIGLVTPGESKNYDVGPKFKKAIEDLLMSITDLAFALDTGLLSSGSSNFKDLKKDIAECKEPQDILFAFFDMLLLFAKYESKLSNNSEELLKKVLFNFLNLLKAPNYYYKEDYEEDDSNYSDIFKYFSDLRDCWGVEKLHHIIENHLADAAYSLANTSIRFHQEQHRHYYKIISQLCSKVMYYFISAGNTGKEEVVTVNDNSVRFLRTFLFELQSNKRFSENLRKDISAMKKTLIIKRFQNVHVILVL